MNTLAFMRGIWEAGARLLGLVYQRYVLGLHWSIQLQAEGGVHIAIPHITVTPSPLFSSRESAASLRFLDSIVNALEVQWPSV